MTRVGTLGPLISLGTRPHGTPGTVLIIPPSTGVTTLGTMEAGTIPGTIVRITISDGMIPGFIVLTTTTAGMVGMTLGSTTLGTMIPGITADGMADGTAGTAVIPGTTMDGAMATARTGAASAEATESTDRGFPPQDPRPEAASGLCQDQPDPGARL